MISYTTSGNFGTDQCAWIARSGVDPKYMGQRIGKSMAEEVFRFYKAKGIRTVYTSVKWISTDLLSFFKTLGFDRSDFVNLQKKASSRFLSPETRALARVIGRCAEFN